MFVLASNVRVRARVRFGASNIVVKVRFGLRFMLRLPLVLVLVLNVRGRIRGRIRV